MTEFSVTEFRQQFPILQRLVNNQPLIYCDNAATTQKPQAVIEAISRQLQNTNANVHRGAHYLSAKATTLYEQARAKVAQYINAPHADQIIWTKGTTESINLLATTIGQQLLAEGDEILLSVAEHHANIVPWQQLAERCGARLVILPIDQQGRIDVDKSLPLIGDNCRFLCINHASNVLGKINDIKPLLNKAKQAGAITVLDAAQTAAHFKIDVQDLDVDFITFSAHKMFGPAGLGVLYGRRSLLDSMPPYQFGGEMIKTVSFEHTEFNQTPHKFEAGTPNLTAVIAMAECIDFLTSDLCQQSLRYEQALIAYAYQKLDQIAGLQWLVVGCPDLPIFSFTLQTGHHQDLASYLDSRGIAVRSGHHCAMPLMQALQLPGSVRVSLAPYNTFAEIDRVVQCIVEFIASEQQPSQTAANVTAIQSEHSVSVSGQHWQDIRHRFSQATGWDAKHREIMLLGKALPRMDKAERTEQHLISGCESNAWLKIANQDNDMLTFEADSDARVIRGLLNIILSLSNGKSSAEILAMDFDAVFDELGLMQHLSPSRGNGLLAIVKRIKELATSNL
ncbi:SufS family cysteine desulfurase [Thalassotalea mangrovi]|uniref:cysteine desulfurase n=1 Tax=Thalassotalea mangrovi TaxID=2572245 RepID=A0A4U1B441_9GAMM|nr:SufS family cysteine desulfurase [Thalassotalea mangrovi]TKB44402.1 SufS family cysteine desulfurase [Thalassotalea mangrovi]